MGREILRRVLISGGLGVAAVSTIPALIGQHEQRSVNISPAPKPYISPYPSDYSHQSDGVNKMLLSVAGVGTGIVIATAGISMERGKKITVTITR